MDDLIAQNYLDPTEQITDSSNAIHFAELHLNTLRYAVGADRWYVRGASHWVPDGKHNVKTLALTARVIRYLRNEAMSRSGDDAEALERELRLVAQQEGVRKRQAMLTLAATDLRLQVEEDDFDAVGNELCAPNGVINLDTGELRPSRPDDMHSRCLTAAYEGCSDEVCSGSEELNLFFETFLPDEADRRYVFALLGDALRMGNPRRLLPIFWGPTTSGKSQLFAALHDLLGSYTAAIGASTFRGNLDDKPRPDLVNAMFTRLAVASEAAKQWALHADQVKRLVGGDPLPYRNLYEGVVNKVPRFTPIIVANEFPQITGADKATKRRIITVHFDRGLKAGEEDPAVKKRFMADPRMRGALLGWLVRGAMEAEAVLKEVPAKYALSTAKAHESLDHVGGFLEWMQEEDYLVPGDQWTASSCVRTSELYVAYTWWLDKFGDSEDKKARLGTKGFSQVLTERGWESVRSNGTRWQGWQLRWSGGPQ